jgi:hypothetical protein
MPVQFKTKHLTDAIICVSLMKSEKTVKFSSAIPLGGIGSMGVFYLTL